MVVFKKKKKNCKQKTIYFTITLKSPKCKKNYIILTNSCEYYIKKKKQKQNCLK